MIRRPTSQRDGFTLIELMLVMVLLIIVVSLVTPTLEKFFAGRKVDSEVRQFISLARYGQSRAVSEGIPMVLWVDTKAGKYGLRQETGYTDNDPKAMDYAVGEGLTLKVDSGHSIHGKTAFSSKTTGIHFSPEGIALTNSSVLGVAIQDGKRPAVWIRPASDGMSYEAQDPNSTPYNARR